MEKKCDIAVVGLAVMGQNLVLNMESNGFRVAVYNRTKSTMERFVEERTEGKEVYPSYSMSELVEMLEKPRKVMLMVKAGKPVDYVMEDLVPHLDEGDIIIDGGNSNFHDTDRRHQEMAEKGIRYLGTGISGGEYGALHGPSIMPGGEEDAYRELEDILTAVAAQTEDGPCVTYLGPRSAGHYVKMVHNGIEYGVMQVLAEVYDLMRKGIEMEPAAMSSVFEEWNKYHQSYLIEITAEILDRIDPETEQPLINVILDRAKQKGTGKWSVQDALELGVAIPTINAAVNARNISGLKEKRVEISKVFPDGSTMESGVLDEEFVNVLEDALYLAIVVSYAEGMDLLQIASAEYEYNLKFDEVARIWEDGCIIRSALLKPIQKAYKKDPYLTNLIMADEFKDDFKEKIGNLRLAVVSARELGIPVPAMTAALDYFDSLRAEELPANLIQGQRDYFGAHTYQRRDREGTFHTEWQDIHNV